MKTVNYLHIALNLKISTYRPYQKENNETKCINTESGHPLSIINELSISIESRPSSLSSSKEIFNDSVKPSEDALDKSGYKHKINMSSSTKQI